jgi:uridine kinase
VATEAQHTQFHQALASLVRSILDRQATPVLVAPCGWADTGKSTLAHRISEEITSCGIASASISTDAFMKDRAERNAIGISGYNPESIDIQALKNSMLRFGAGEPFTYHRYDNRTGTKQQSPSVVEPCRVLVVEGIHSFHPTIAERMHLKVFIDSDEPTLRHMRFRANMQKRGMCSTDAEAMIQAEWNDYVALLRPLSKSANLAVHVDQDFNYRWQT